MQSTTIAVIGDTGKIGSVLTQSLVEKGYKLKLLVRTPEKISQNSSVVLVKGDARDIDALNELVKGCDLLINCIGQPKGEAPLFSLVAENVLNAMSNQGLCRYIVIAGLGLEIETDKKRFVTKFLTRFMHFVLPSIMNDKKLEFKLIAGSSLDWTFIRIPKVTLSSPNKAVTANESDCLSWKVNVYGLVEFMISQIESQEYVKKAPFVFSMP